MVSYSPRAFCLFDTVGHFTKALLDFSVSPHTVNYTQVSRYCLYLFLNLSLHCQKVLGTIKKFNYTLPPILNSVFTLLATHSLPIEADYLWFFSSNDHYTYLDHIFSVRLILVIQPRGSSANNVEQWPNVTSRAKLSLFQHFAIFTNK